VQTGITNARTEGYNRLVKQVNRSAADSAIETTPPGGTTATRKQRGRNPDFMLTARKRCERVSRRNVSVSSAWIRLLDKRSGAEGGNKGSAIGPGVYGFGWIGTDWT
jgi:hypothetical protein